ncbi:porin family protein [Marinicauda sp. Alg238-R41]|jgi:opacity protein-like surface antigen|uniref:porin family protein n=1 Tax=Marinicauda sp. Alg238-R41 TaxID=2993447 RepID=UPI0022E2245B|nr:porin family protein [Marinicauda sp. Alg238-R41]
MKTLLLASAAALAVTAGASAQDAGNVHFGAGYTFLDFDGIEFDALNLRGGYDFNDYVGVEGEALIGLGDEDVTAAGITGDVSLDYIVGAYAKAQYPVGQGFNLFARAGYAYAEAEASAAGLTLSDSTDGFAYGAGAEWAFNGPNAVRVEYTRYEFEDDAEADSFGASYVRRF